MNDVTLLVDEIRTQAAAFTPPLEVEENPEGMRSRRLWATEAANALDSDAQAELETLDADDLPKNFIALRVGYHSLLIGGLGDDPADAAVDHDLARYQNQAAIAWSWLGHKGDDLLLLLVAPAGGEESRDWKRMQRRVERNEQVCRKLVWLPPQAGKDRSKSLKAFWGRTFLARPWPRKGEAGQGQLDRWALLAKQLVQDEFDEATAKRWLKILSYGDLKDADRVRCLIEALDPANPDLTDLDPSDLETDA
ncbi:hypothetical protein ACHMW5_36140 (plasmid) [Azospirillum melinis]|uniref:hypothetical protein n=1 Tax=Azospirillum melinis TaxID=328839 RepID=UPI00375756E4